jgi:hypothetical protein
MSGQREDRDGETPAGTPAETTAMLDTAGLDRLASVLIERGYQVVGPTLRDNAIVLAELESAEDLPRGWGVDVGPVHYRLHRRDDDAAFAHSAGPQSWKQFLHPPRQRLWSDDRGGEMSDVAAEEIPRYAFIGVRGCDLAGIATLDRVLGGGKFPDGSFARRRRQIFVVAVNCTEPGGLCFCASMGTGPAAGPGYDLALTERVDGDGRRYLVDVGTEDGAEVLATIPHCPAKADEIRDWGDDMHQGDSDAASWPHGLPSIRQHPTPPTRQNRLGFRSPLIAQPCRTPMNRDCDPCTACS